MTRTEMLIMKTNLLGILRLTVAAALFSLAPSAPAAALQALSGHVPAAVANLQPTGRLSATNRLHLAVALAPRNREGLEQLLKDQQDPQSPSFHQYLSLEEFTKRFGPTQQDYRKAIAFAQANGLKVSGTYSNRIILDMEGPVADVEKALHVTIRTYRHPTENREFYAPDTEPALDLAVPLLNITGLDNYHLPHPVSHHKPIQPTSNGATPNMPTPNGPKPDGSSGPSGTYAPADLRNAYVPGTTLTGAGQSVGLLELSSDLHPPYTGGYYVSDLTNFEHEFSLPPISVTTVPVAGGLVTTGQTGGQTECTLDIEMVMAMAPGASIYVFECPAYFNDVLSTMVSYPSIKQFSTSWSISDHNLEPNLVGDFLLMEMAAQGQSFFASSGDSDAYGFGGGSDAGWPQDSPCATVVGGTVLTMNGSGASYASETVWNEFSSTGYDTGSGGGISSSSVGGNYLIPYWQQGISMSVNGGSTTHRNSPDVAMVASNIDTYIGGSDGGAGGTSVSAPLWAGFMALVNQQAASLGNPSAGFINPAIYAIGKGTGNTPYADAFHDITTGNNDAGPGAGYPAVAGYDLCTGWGTPAIGLINALAGGAAAPYHLVVLNTNDSGAGSLRQAISNAVSGAYITFSNTLAGATIRLTSGELMISSNLTIDASALPGGLTINGGHNGRIIQVANGATSTLVSLTLTNGYLIGSDGAAIYNAGVLSLANCTLAGNTFYSSSSGQGGAVGNVGRLTLNGCTFSGNLAGYGGAILNQGAVCSMQNCTFAGNTSSVGGGGAIMNVLAATLNILHCTFTGNSAAGSGGDIDNSSSQVNITNSILAASTPNDIYNEAGSTNTLGGSNIVQVLNNAGTLIGTNTIRSVNPQLATLGNHGGPTWTMPPLAGSPAIDAASSTTLLTDQRGYPRPVGPAADIGAVEFQDASPIVTTAADSGIGSLRYATTYTTNGDYITFATNLSGATILSSGTLTLDKSLTIDASALPGGITINGNQAGSVFLVTNANVVLTALTITNGHDVSTGGGGIFNYEVLTVNQCTLSGNSTTVGGGGIATLGIAVVNESTLTGNSGPGGGIYNSEGAVTINESTLTGNSGPCGGIYNIEGAVTINQSTLTGNSDSSGLAGGIYTDQSLAQVRQMSRRLSFFEVPESAIHLSFER
jgi:xanthomonalisin